MIVKVENKGSCRKVLHIEAPSDAVADEYNKVLKAFEKGAKIPGFRKGKAPKDVTKLHFATQIEEEVKERLLPQLYRDAVKKKQIKTVSIVEISEVEFSLDSGIAFGVTVDVYPEFKIPKYKKITLKKTAVEIADSDVEDAVKRLLDNFAKFEDVTGRAVKSDDLVMVDYTSECEGKSVEELVPTSKGIGEGKDFWMMVGEPELAPGFADGLKGTEIGDKKDIKIHFPDDYQLTDLSCKDAVYHVEIKGIREKALPDIDEELLKRLQVKSEDELRERIREDLVSEKERMENERLKSEITTHLLAKTSFDLPETIVQHETASATKSMVDRLAMQGRATAQIELEKESIADMARKTSEEKVRISYILARIADEEQIDVEESELNDRLGMMAMRYGMTAGQLRSELENRDSLSGVQEDLRAEKTLTFILENAKIKN